MKVVRARTPVREGKQWRGGAWLAAYLWLPSLAQLRIAGRASQRDAVIMAGARPRHLGAFSSMHFDGASSLPVAAPRYNTTAVLPFCSAPALKKLWTRVVQKLFFCHCQHGLVWFG